MGSSESGARDWGNRRDQEPHFPTTTPTPHAPVPEAAVWMTSSHKHALFLRKWKVSEVWWGEWVSAATALRAPPCLTPHPRGGLIGEKMSSVAPSLTLHSSAPNPEKSEKLGRGCLSQRREEGNHDPGDGKIPGFCQMLPSMMPPSRRWQGGTLHNLPPVPLSLPRHLTSLFSSPVAGKT